MTRRLFLAGLILGGLIRLAALPLPGTLDVSVWKIWSHAAATGGVSGMYGVGGTPLERRLLEYDGRRATVDYPPVALYELAVVGRAYRFVDPGFANTPALNAVIKLLPVLAEFGLTVLIVWVTGRVAPRQPALAYAAGLAYWLNPAALMDTAVLGYLDALFALPLLGSLAAAYLGWPALAGGLVAAAVLTKAQAVLVLPVIVFAVWQHGAAGSRWGLATRGLARAGAGAGAVTAVALAPFALAGALPNLGQALASLARHDMLSATAANLWWIVTWVMRAAYAAGEFGLAEAFLMPVRRPLAISRVIELGYPDPRPWATAAVLALVAWAMWKGRRQREWPLLAALGAFAVWAYFTLAVQVHENHLFMAVPLLVVAAAGRPAFRWPLAAASAVLALNLNLFYGIGDRVGYAIPRTVTVVDASVLLAVANVAAFATFAWTLGRETSRAGALAHPARPAAAPPAT